MTIQENLVLIKKFICDYEQKYKRPKNAVQLLAASKGQSIEKIQEAFQAGQYAFGENYLQEALAKITHSRLAANLSVKSTQRVAWHFIGPIQSNKTRKIAEHFSWVHSVDQIKIAKRLNDQRPTHLPPLNICIEVNVNQEPSKSGVMVENVHSLATACLDLPQLKLRGLMTIPVSEQVFDKQRQTFRQLFTLYQTLRDDGLPLDTLSMGMSNDFEAAIAEGATIVRIGTAIFGNR